DSTRQPTEGRFLATESFAAAVDAENVEDVRVFYGPDAIVAVLELASTYLRWQHEMRLPRHPAFARLQRLTNTEVVNQRSLIRLLRADLNGHVDDRVVEQFRTLNLKVEGGGQAVIAKGREGVDRRIQQEVTAAHGAEIPDEIVVTVPVYDLDEARGDLHEVTLLVDVRPGDDSQAVFELTAVLNTLKSAESVALDRLVTALRGGLPDGVPVYYGSPK
nr:hypothetical protein [Gemmatimonadaceae bacterium]